MEVVVTTGAISRGKAPVKSSTPTNQHPVFFLQAGFPSCHPTIRNIGQMPLLKSPITDMALELRFIGWKTITEAWLGHWENIVQNLQLMEMFIRNCGDVWYNRVPRPYVIYCILVCAPCVLRGCKNRPALWHALCQSQPVCAESAVKHQSAN